MIYRILTGVENATAGDWPRPDAGSRWWCSMVPADLVREGGRGAGSPPAPPFVSRSRRPGAAA